MGFLEAVKCGVSQSAELAGSDQTRERQRQRARRRLVGGQIACPPIRPGPSLPPHPTPPHSGPRLQASDYRQPRKLLSQCHGLTCSPNPSSPPPSPQKGAIFGNRASKEVIKLKHSHMSGHCPYKGIRTHTHTHREDQVKTQGEDRHLQAPKGPLLLTLCSQISDFQNWGKIHVCSWSPQQILS